VRTWSAGSPKCEQSPLADSGTGLWSTNVQLSFPGWFLRWRRK